MTDSKKKISWTPIIIVAMVLIFLLIIIFNFPSGEISDFTQSSDNLISNAIGNEVQEVSINAISQVRTINYPNQEISLDLNGNYNVVTITKETFVVEINLNGVGNTLNLCKNHSPQIEENGISNDIDYLDC